MGAITVGDSAPITSSQIREKIRNDIDDLTTTVNQLDLIDSKGTALLTAEYTLISNA